MRKVTNPFNCRPFGQAIKAARTKMGLSRRKVEETHNIDARYLFYHSYCPINLLSMLAKGYNELSVMVYIVKIIRQSVT